MRTLRCRFQTTLSTILAAICCLSVPRTLPAVTNTTSVLKGGAVLENGIYNEFIACEEFRAEGTNGSLWLLEDCINVWRDWAPTVTMAPRWKKEEEQFFSDVSDRLRRQGNPCHVQAPYSWDGVGSRTLRYLATWSYAKEMGCDCLLPKGYRSKPSTDDVLYCHQIKRINPENFSCSAVDWMEYFNISAHMKPYPDDGRSAKTIEIGHSLSGLHKAKDRFFEQGGFENPPWVHWILNVREQKLAGELVARPDTWNAAKRQIVRDVLDRVRAGFRRYPRPSFQAGQQECKFEFSQTNIAIHVRLGDRDGHQGAGRPNKHHGNYFDKLEDFMDTVSAGILRQGEAPPVFHIFSETAQPCPSKTTGAFDEFLRWPVETDQIDPCLAAVVPDECWEKTLGAPTCPSPRSGVFLVGGKSLYLHVGLDVENAMSCMIEADGLLMGCSTFGQVAGLFSEGLRFFSVGCEGWATAPHYQLMPPMVRQAHLSVSLNMVQACAHPSHLHTGEIGPSSYRELQVFWAIPTSAKKLKNLKTPKVLPDPPTTILSHPHHRRIST
ncbi:unnamed protein product [Scytosiphon promiscuus]